MSDSIFLCKVCSETEEKNFYPYLRKICKNCKVKETALNRSQKREEKKLLLTPALNSNIDKDINSMKIDILNLENNYFQLQNKYSMLMEKINSVILDNDKIIQENLSLKLLLNNKQFV